MAKCLFVQAQTAFRPFDPDLILCKKESEERKMSNEIKKNRVSEFAENSASNCHRPSGGSPAPGSSDQSDQDSSTSKYVVSDDRRDRRDGPGGN